LVRVVSSPWAKPISDSGVQIDPFITFRLLFAHRLKQQPVISGLFDQPVILGLFDLTPLVCCLHAICLPLAGDHCAPRSAPYFVYIDARFCHRLTDKQSKQFIHFQSDFDNMGRINL
jgi:hypothetical protein